MVPSKFNFQSDLKRKLFYLNAIFHKYGQNILNFFIFLNFAQTHKASIFIREQSLRIQQTGAEGIVLGHGIFCHENVGVWKIFSEFFGA